MARGQVNKLYRTFVKGLVTEAGFLTYPEDSSTDELNTVLHRKGNRTRRLGIDYEPDSTQITFAGREASSSVTSEFLWRAPGNASINFLVIQVASILYFFDASVTPLSMGKKSFIVDIDDFRSPSATTSQILNTPVSMASGNGMLFVAHEFIEPFTVEYDEDEDTIEAIKVIIQMRDFDGVHDGLAPDQEPSTLSKEHFYNLRNQGWVKPGTTPASGGSSGGIPTGTTTTYDPWTGNPRRLDPSDPDPV